MFQSEWWGEQVESDLSQGDIVANLPIFLLVSPLKYLRHTNLRGNTPGWMDSDSPVVDRDGRTRLHAIGKSLPGLVLSHSCELDKRDRRKRRVIVAPIVPIGTVSDVALRDSILAQAQYASMPLPDIPGLGTYYADLRSIVTLDRDIVDKGKRLASMTELAQKRLWAQLVAFFLRKEIGDSKSLEQ
ncbi:MAG: hypothetical protein HY525_07140 [Betaproteobacteria bacterium]|nr:hypothetical protein [Betaproteobacteria bacterium]